MKQLNHLLCSNILRLENFKIYSEEHIWRFYLEVCPFGDLEELIRRYRIYK